jgi:hypothetical protein
VLCWSCSKYYSLSASLAPGRPTLGLHSDVTPFDALVAPLSHKIESCMRNKRARSSRPMSPRTYGPLLPTAMYTAPFTPAPIPL